MSETPNSFASSTGHDLSSDDWLDLHFEASRPEYEAQLRAVGIQVGWHVLDAACGSGSFLPWLADLVGSQGQLAALDLAPENVQLVERRVADWLLPCPVEAQVGNVLALPYPDDTFDAVWFANTSQYLTNTELETALTEFKRVVRPGGLVAVKESDATTFRALPAPNGFMQRVVRATAAAGYSWAAGALRAPELPDYLRRVGLVDVWQRSTLIERHAPFNPATRATWQGGFSIWATVAAQASLPAADQDLWTQIRDPAGLERFLNDTDRSIIEGNILTVGAVSTGATGAA